MPPAAAQSSGNGSTRTRILEAALEVLIGEGPAKTSMTAIARRAGLSRQGLYLHFSSKDELTYAAARHQFEARHARAQAILASDRPITERLVSALTAVSEPIRRGTVSRAARFWQGYETPVMDRVVEMANGFEQAFVKLLADALASDGLGPRPSDARGCSAVELATVLSATARGLTLLPQPLSNKEYAELIRLAVIRLCAPAGRRSSAKAP